MYSTCLNAETLSRAYIPRARGTLAHPMSTNTTSPPSEGFLLRLRDVLGRDGWLDEPGAIDKYLTDFRSLYRGATPLVACPADTSQVSAVLALCNDAHVGVVPHGGNTSYCGGAPPGWGGGGIGFSLHRLHRIRSNHPPQFLLVAGGRGVL